jgi:hypothetical protein
VLLTTLLSVAKTTEMRINNKTTFDRQSGNISKKRILLPEVVCARPGRCR